MNGIILFIWHTFVLKLQEIKIIIKPTGFKFEINNKVINSYHNFLEIKFH